MTGVKMKKGITYVEMIISMTLLAITTLAISQIIYASIQNSIEAQLRYKAAIGAQSIYEEVQARLGKVPFLGAGGLYAFMQATEEEFEELFNAQYFDYSVSMNDVFLTTGEGVPNNSAGILIDFKTTGAEVGAVNFISVDVYEKGGTKLLFRLVDVVNGG